MRTILSVALFGLAACGGGSTAAPPEPPEPTVTLPQGRPEVRGRVAMTLHHRTGGPSVWIANADGSDLELIAEHATCPRFARDGRKLAWVTLGGEVRYRDFPANAETGTGHQGFSPTWDPTGDRIAYVDRSGVVQVLDLVTGVARRVAIGSARSVEALEWSPTSEELLVSILDGNGVPGFTLQLAALAGSSRPVSTWFQDARWAPDGRSFSCSSGVADRFGRPVLGNPQGLSPLAWSRDGKGLIALARTVDGPRYVISDFDGQIVSVLPVPVDHVIPLLIDYGNHWVDWSWD